MTPENPGLNASSQGPYVSFASVDHRANIPRGAKQTFYQ
jgi:hypothetical protein